MLYLLQHCSQIVKKRCILVARLQLLRENMYICTLYDYNPENMNKIEKISIARIVSDLIKADSVIDSREMELFDFVKEDYRLNRECLSDARFITFSDAVNNLCRLPEDEKRDLMDLFKKITLADGMCNKDEALLMIALSYCLEGKYEAEMVHVQVPQQGLQLENSQVIYVESFFDKEINEVIGKNFQQIENAMRLAGFDFAYIPQIARTYRATPAELFNDVMTFLTPNLDEKELARIQEKVSSMTTKEFCQEQLCKKLHMNCLADTHPSLLMKVGETISESNIYANFLKIVIDQDILGEIKQFMYRFTSMMNAEYSILRNIYNSNDRFVYSGVYKQIMDSCLMKENSMSIVLLDTMKQKIRFPEINEELKVSRSEKALYVLVLAESLTGGLNLNQPVSIKQMKLHEEKARKLIRKYAQIYHFFGGEVESVPNIMDPTIRNPKISKINKCISSLNRKLSSPDEYMIQRTNDGLYKINVDSSMIYCFDTNPTPWMQSDRWRTIVSM